MISPSAEQQIRERLANSRPVDDRVVKLRYEHGGGRMYLDGKDRSLILDVYEEGDREFYFNAAADVQTLLTLLASLSQELERIRIENKDLQARVDSLRLLEGTGSTASTERR